MSTAEVNLDLTQYVRVNAGLNPMILQAHRDDVRIAFSPMKPARSNTAIHLLGCDDPPYAIPFTDENVWALAMTATSSLVVTEFNTVEDPDKTVETLDELAKKQQCFFDDSIGLQTLMLSEMRLLNARAEHAWNTGIEHIDIEDDHDDPQG